MSASAAAAGSGATSARAPASLPMIQRVLAIPMKRCDRPALSYLSREEVVAILDAAGYVRYDFSTATRLLAIMEELLRAYGGDLNKLHEQALDSVDLERLLKLLGPGIGDVTVTIFLRELRTVWPKSRPPISAPALLAAGHLGLLRPGEEPLAALERVWSSRPVAGNDFCDFEAALVRLGKGFCGKGRHDLCPLRDVCGKADGGG